MRGDPRSALTQLSAVEAAEEPVALFTPPAVAAGSDLTLPGPVSWVFLPSPFPDFDPSWKWVLAAVTRNPAVICPLTSHSPCLVFFFFPPRSAWMNNIVYFYHPLRLGGNHSCYAGMSLRPLMSCYWVNPL